MLHALMLTTLAGLATGLGGVLAVIRRPGPRAMGASMGFAAGVMLAMSGLDLLPEALEAYRAAFGPGRAALAAASLLILGILAAALLEGCLPEETAFAQTAGEGRAGVLRGALVTGLALLLHNLPEGILTLFSGIQDPQAGLRLALSIGLHNLPEGLAVAAPIYYATGSRAKGAGAAFVSGLAEPVGAVLAFWLVGRWLTPGFVNGLLVWVAGIMSWAAVYELLPTGIALAGRGRTAAGFCAGVLAMLLGIGALS